MKWYRNGAVALALATLTCFQYYGCTSGSGGLAPVRSRVNVQPYEVLSSTQKTINLKCLVEEYGSPCQSVVMNVSSSGNSYTILFEGIYTSPGPCPAVIVPLIATIKLGNLSAGDYNLNFIVNGVKNTLGISVNSTSVILSGSDTSWVRYENPVLTRVPPNTLWGWVSYGGSGMDTVVTSFLDSLRLMGATRIELADGYYYYFSVDSGKIVTTNPYVFVLPSVQYFALKYSGSFYRVAQLAVSYLGRYQNILSIDAFDAAGDMFPQVIEMRASEKKR